MTTWTLILLQFHIETANSNVWNLLSAKLLYRFQPNRFCSHRQRRHDFHFHAHSNLKSTVMFLAATWNIFYRRRTTRLQYHLLICFFDKTSRARNTYHDITLNQSLKHVSTRHHSTTLKWCHLITLDTISRQNMLLLPPLTQATTNSAKYANMILLTRKIFNCPWLVLKTLYIVDPVRNGMRLSSWLA